MSDKKAAKDKLLIIFLVFLGLGTLWLGFSDIGSRIKGPLNNDKKTNLENDSLNNIENIIELQKTDTDNDGLSDYDEINVYHTSIYLPDTDSDGFLDKQEIDSGHDPNCPDGYDCSLPSGEIVDFNNESVGSDLINSEEILIDPETENLLKAEKIFSGTASVEEVKQILIAGGMSESDLKQIPDSEIIKMYQDLIETYNAE